MKIPEIRHIILKGLHLILPAMLLALLTGCIFSDEGQGPGITLALRFPGDMPRQNGMDLTRASELMTRRCIVELYEPGTRSPVARKIVRVPNVLNETATVSVRFDEDIPLGKYDVAIWSDYVATDDVKEDNFYNTSLLSDIRIIPRGSDYPAEVSPKEAAYAFLPGVEIGCGGKAHKVWLRRPLSRYVVLSEDVDRYERYSREKPHLYPPVDELVFVIKYQFYFPVGFDVTSGSPSDASLDMEYSVKASQWENTDPGKTVLIADDYILTGNRDSYLTLILEVRSATGRLLSRTTGLRVDFRQGYQTIIRGNFLTLSIITGIIIDTSWEDDIIYDI